MATRITIHASPLLLQRGVRGVAGQPMEIVLHVPTAPELSVHGFARDSAFPSPSVLAAVPALARAASQHPDARLMLFGHTDESGGDDHNKKVADRRAKVVFALVTHDLEQLDQIAREDGWKLIHYQAIMKALGAAPLSVDGELSPQTVRGIRAFQRAYNAGEYHAHAQEGPAHAALKVDGKLGAHTEAALRDAYLASLTVRVAPERFMGPKTAGCGEFNRTGNQARDRRVALALYGADFPTESRIPCREGDVAACKLNRKTKHPRKCNFYRRTLEDEVPLEAQPLPARVKLLAQTVDELGYRLGQQPLIFIDDAGLESHVATDEQGVFDGFVHVSGNRLDVLLPDGTLQLAWEGAFNQPVLLDLVVRSNERSALTQEHTALAQLYDRTPVENRRGRRVPPASEVLGEPWSSISDRTGASDDL